MSKFVHYSLILTFVLTGFQAPKAQAGEVVGPVFPKPGAMVLLSPAFMPAHLKGIVIDPNNALKFDFLINQCLAKNIYLNWNISSQPTREYLVFI